MKTLILAIILISFACDNTGPTTPEPQIHPNVAYWNGNCILKSWPEICKGATGGRDYNCKNAIAFYGNYAASWKEEKANAIKYNYDLDTTESTTSGTGQQYFTCKKCMELSGCTELECGNAEYDSTHPYWSEPK